LISLSLGLDNIQSNTFLYSNIKHIAPKSLERNERNQLFRDVERNVSLRDISIVYVLLLTGLRVSELCSLNREDLSMSERSGQIVVIGKGKVSRTVPISVEYRLHLQRYLALRQDYDLALFMSNFNRRMTIRSVQHMLKKYGVHPHKLRHTFCRELVAAGIDISTVAELAGHADINMTRRYSKPTSIELQLAIDRVFS
jgi:integrase/recombinase XerD